MATTYSTNLALTLQGTGDNPGTWGDITNTNLGTLIEQAISGYETQSLTAGTTLTLTIPNGSTGVARNMYLEFTGNGSTVIVPSNKKLYFVYNNCSSGTITMKVAGQTGVTVEKGSKQILVSNGTDITTAITGLNGFTTSALTALGTNAGDSITSGTDNTFIGYNAGTSVTTGTFNTAVGYLALSSTVSALGNTAVGYLALQDNTAGLNTAVGSSCLKDNTTGSNNTAVGHGALFTNATGGNNTAVGTYALNASTSDSNTGLGYSAGSTITSGIANTVVGYNAGQGITSGSSNTALGDSSYASGNYGNSIALGYNAQVTSADQGKIGNGDVDVYAKSFNNTSDLRDKADIQDTNLGLDFVMQLKPRMFRWDMREFYAPPPPTNNATPEEWDAWREATKLSNLTHDGSKKRNRLHQGLVAQEVKETLDTLGVDFGGFRDSSVNGGDAQMGLEYTQFVAPLIKAIQELKAEFDEYKRTHP